MVELMQAFEIFMKYDKDMLFRMGDDGIMYIHINPTLVSDEDQLTVERYGFIPDWVMGYFYSFRHGR